MKTTCCGAPIMMSALRHIFYCKTCKRVVNDDLFEKEKENAVRPATPSLPH